VSAQVAATSGNEPSASRVESCRRMLIGTTTRAGPLRRRRSERSMYLGPKPDGPARGFKPTPLTWRSTGRAGIQLLSRFSQSTYGCLQPCISSPASRTSLITPSTSRSTQACPPGSLRRWHRAMVNAQVNRRAATDAHTQEARVPFESSTWLTMATIQPTLRGGRVANSPDHRSEPPTRGRHWHRFSSREQKPYWSG